MEVVRRIGKSDCPDGKPDSLRNGELVTTDVEVDAQNLSSQSCDPENEDLDERDHFAGLELVLDETKSERTNNDEEGSSRSEIKSLEQDDPQAVWVKWRGKWQAGISCARVDWPLSTLKAKPTHDRKQYLVIFFPMTRNYSWADVLLVRPINEFPYPIAYKSHAVGLKMVSDLSFARRFIMQRLSVSMLNILNQLNREALSESARDVMVLKDFAMEASCCKQYFDLGRMLLKLQNMILQRYITSNWVHQSSQSWKQRCQDANSAESIEVLKEELADSISWEEVNSLPTSEALPSDWKSWKHEAMKWFSVSHLLPTDVGQTQPTNNNSPPTTGLQAPNKRPKLEIRRADTRASGPSHPSVPAESTSSFVNHNDVVVNTLSQTPKKNEEATKWDDIVLQDAGYSTLTTTSVIATPRKPLAPDNHNRQCAAFIESKWRQCVRYVSEEDIYCCMHLSTRVVPNSNKKAKIIATHPMDLPMCVGTTVHGTKCKYRALVGTSFCKKHRKTASTSSSNTIKTKIDENLMYTKSPVPGEGEFLAITDQVFVKMPESERVPQTSGVEEVVRCMGSGIEEEEPCLEIPKRHSLYCEKHIPNWLKCARNGKTRIVTKEVFIDLLKSCPLREQKLRLHQACEHFYRLFKSVLSLRNPVPKEVQFQWAISEASKDARVGEYLKKLVSHEKERLMKLWDFGDGLELQQQSSSSVEELPLVPVQASNNNNNNNCDAQENIIKCKVCSGIFLDDQELGKHWMDSHKKQAQWLFRSYVCSICLDSFTNRKVLESHVQERHHVEFVEQCMLLQCIPCASHFGNLDQLWAHVLLIHPPSLRFSNESEHQDEKVGETNTVPDNNSVKRRYFCKFCGLKFDLLPDLGRHHQAAHMGVQMAKNGIKIYARKLKSGRLTRIRFKKALNSASYKIRNRSMQNLKKWIQASNNITDPVEVTVQSSIPKASYKIRNRSMQHLKKWIQASDNITDPVEVTVQSSIPKAAIANHDTLVDSQCSSIAKILISAIEKTKSRPSNSEILSIATSACCKVSLQASLEGKYGTLPERLYLKAAKLCSEHNISIDWHRDGFVCTRGCMPSLTLVVSTPVKHTSDNSVKSRYLVPSNLMASEWSIDECHCVIDSRHFSMDLSERNISLCDDISFGQESVPIACVVDEVLLNAEGTDGQVEYSFPWESFTYITKPLPDNLVLPEPESLQLGCTCAHSTCSSEACDHVYLFDNDYEDAKDIHGNPMRGRFPYNERGRIILEEGYLVYECNQRCYCTRACQNRVLQNGVNVDMEIFKTETKGWALRTRQAILRGTFVCEYIGEVIDQNEANERRMRYSEEGCKYYYEIDAHINDMSRLVEGQVPYVIDATNYGNVSRYINHSCSPNLVNHQVLVESMDSRLAHIGLYAGRDIAVGEELTYDYRYKLLSGEGCPCLCGFSNCRGRLY